MKKRLLLLVVLAILFSSFVYADVTGSANCSGTSLFKLSDIANAHAGTMPASTYNYIACFQTQSGISSVACDGSNGIVGLSAVTNAHAEEYPLTNYATDVCFDNLGCQYEAGSCSPSFECVGSMSGSTNAHAGGCAAYNLKICCKVGFEFGEGSEWNNMHDQKIFVANQSDRVKLVTKGSGFIGQNISFTIYEKNGGFLGLWDSKIGTIDGYESTSWVLGDEDFDGSSDSINENRQYYFDACNVNLAICNESYNLLMTQQEHNTPPVAIITSPLNRSVYSISSSISFSHASYDIDDSIVSVKWDLGDGTNETSDSFTHAYSSTGQKTIWLTVTDERGASARTLVSILVVNPSVDSKEVFAWIDYPAFGQIFDQQEVKFNASGTYALEINITTNPGIYCIAGKYCPSQIQGGVPITPAAPVGDEYRAVNFTWVFDKGSFGNKYNHTASGWNGVQFKWTFSDVGRHTTLLIVSTNPSSSFGIEFQTGIEPEEDGATNRNLSKNLIKFIIALIVILVVYLFLTKRKGKKKPGEKPKVKVQRKVMKKRKK
ncbi:MAG: PKD domain-containing protein [archaeon]